MEVAAAFYESDARVKTAELELKDAREERGKLEDQMKDLIEQNKLPSSFKQGRGSIYTHSQLWASVKDKDHERATGVLESLGLVEFLPSTVNSQKLSAYVREFVDDLGQVKIGGEDGLDPRLAEVLNITERVSVRATGN